MLVKRKIKLFLFISYMVLLIYMLFLSDGRCVMSTYRYNLEPFKEIIRFIKYRHVVGYSAFVINVIGNVVAFMPFGFFIPHIVVKRTGCIKVLSLTFIFTLSVETIQLVSKLGRFDIDDIILNTLGGILGYILYLIYRKIRS